MKLLVVVLILFCLPRVNAQEKPCPMVTGGEAIWSGNIGLRYTLNDGICSEEFARTTVKFMGSNSSEDIEGGSLVITSTDKYQILLDGVAIGEGVHVVSESGPAR